MPYQYKRERLSNDEVNRLINVCETFEKKFVIWNAFYNWPWDKVFERISAATG
jgi:hypothetical protein